MGLKADFEEVQQAWPSYPWRLKLWLILSLLVASGSIASLSETIFRWKGFLLDAVTFYGRYVSTPLQSLIQAVYPFALPNYFSDWLVVTAMVVSANVRIARHGALQRFGSKPFVALLVVLPALPLLENLISPNSLMGSPFPYAVVLLIFNILLVSAIGGAARLLWFVYVFAPPSFVCLAAAVNSGITRAA